MPGIAVIASSIPESGATRDSEKVSTICVGEATEASAAGEAETRRGCAAAGKADTKRVEAVRVIRDRRRIGFSP
ncbi:hypothetical protein SmB9_17630 [Sphingosinicella microcystinivorans]|uniref:Uncharacterized protein n=1 Tax=Sphingosinicella microcystinivorans TaxID=335406 RepID=A0AAD1G0Y2_SPHMI|nr:hypothetical protein SmB9_17630 [Sphingosinicella microcystinivorans]